jgi:exopolyphosphatase/pppGpp-phosphohydrolase
MSQATNASQREPSPAQKRHAIIEIGARGIRLLIADASPAGIERIVYSTGELSHLGQELDSTGAIPPQTIRRIKGIVAAYQEQAEQNEAGDLLVIATESIRDAPNRADFEAEIGRLAPLQVLDKEDEAVFALLATVDAFERDMAPGSTLLVVDQGGGSTELIYGYLGQDGQPALKAALALNFGTMALSRLFVSSPSASVAWARISQQLGQALKDGDYEASFADLLQRPPDLAVALGSAITFYMRDEIASVEGRKPRLRDLHGRHVDPGGIVGYLGRIQPTLDELGLSPGDFSPESDEAIVLSGLVIYAVMAQKHALDRYTISRSGMRYGALSWRAGRRVLLES